MGEAADCADMERGIGLKLYTHIVAYCMISC